MKRRIILPAFLTFAVLSPFAYSVWSETIGSVLPFFWSRRRAPEAFIADPLFRPEAVDKVVQPPPVVRSMMIERNTILVMFREGTSARDIKGVLKRHRLVARSGVPRIRFFVCQTDDSDRKATDAQEATRLRAIAASLEKNERQWVEMAEVNAVLGKTTIPRPNAPVPRNWFATAPAAEDPFVLSGFPQAWNFNDAVRRRGTRVSVGVLDVGFLSASRTARRDLDVSRVGPGTGVDDHGHLVAGIIGAQFDNQLIADGGSPFAEIHGCAPSAPPPGRVFGATPEDREFNRLGVTVGDLIDCLDILAAVPVRVINASVGYNWREHHRIRPAQQPPTARSLRAQTMVTRHGTMVRRMLDDLRGNIVVVSAAGNDSGDPAKWGSPFNWAALDASEPPATNVIVVEALDATGAAPLGKSSRGGTIAAVGVNIPSVSANRLREEIHAFCEGGTSCAAPLVTATVAQMLAVNPALSVADIKRNLGVSLPANPLNAFAAVQASARRPDSDLADYDRDNDVDLDDFDRFKRDLQAFDEGRRTGIFRIDLNGDDVRDANDARFCRSDFDGQNGINGDDLNVMIRAWTDRSVDPSTLPTRLLQ
jgi:hypothetical protein